MFDTGGGNDRITKNYKFRGEIMKKTLTVLLLSVVAGLFFSCSNSSDTSTLMTVAVIQQQQAAEAAAVKSASVSVGDVYQVPDMTIGSDTFHCYYKVTSSTNVEQYFYKNDKNTPEDGCPMNVAYNTNTSGSSKFIQNEGNTYLGTFIAKGNDNTSFCTTWSYTVSGTTISYQFNTDKTGVCSMTITGEEPITTSFFTYTVSSNNSNIYIATMSGVECKFYYDSDSGITMFGDSTKLTKVSGLPA